MTAEIVCNIIMTTHSLVLLRILALVVARMRVVVLVLQDLAWVSIISSGYLLPRIAQNYSGLACPSQIWQYQLQTRMHTGTRPGPPISTRG